MKFQLRYIILLIITIISLCSCGRGNLNQLQEQAEWKQSGFAVNGEVQEKQELYIQEYISWKHEEVVCDEETERFMDNMFDMPHTEVGTYDGKIYRLNNISEAQYVKEKRWILEIYDTLTMQNSVKEISLADLDIENCESNRFLVGMDVVNEGSYIFQWKELAKEDNKYYQKTNKFIYSDLKGSTQTTDLKEAYGKLGIKEGNPSEFYELPTGYCVCDSQGNTYVVYGAYESATNELSVLDKQGNELLKYSAPQSCINMDYIRTPQGEIIFLVYDNETKSYSLIFPDIETKETRILAQLKDEKTIIKQLFGMQGNQVYYETQVGIVKWNIADGNRTLIFNYAENGISPYFSTMLILREDKTPVLRLYQKTREELNDWLLPLSETKVLKENSVQIVDLLQSNSSTKILAGVASEIARKNLGEQYFYQTAKGDREEYHKKIFTELANGEGPDILYLSRSDMDILYDSKVLMNLQEILGQEELDVILPGALDLGTAKGELVGLPINVFAGSLAISKKVYNEEYWDLETMLQLIENGSLEGGFYYSAINNYYAPLASVNLVLRKSLDNSFLIDWQNRESHFEDKRFCRLLDCMRKPLNNEGETYGFEDGKRIAEISLTSKNGLYDFGVMVDKGEAYYIGYPTNGTSGNYLETDGVLVVNKNTKNKELVQKYIEGILDNDIEESSSSAYNNSLGIKKLSLNEIVYDEDGKAFWNGQEIFVFEDGTTSLHRAKEFLESCVGGPREYPNLDIIIFEELSAWATDNKSAETVASIIDSRVQVYMDEEN